MYSYALKNGVLNLTINPEFKPENQWVSTGTSRKDNFPKSPKRDHGGNEIISPLNGDIQVTTVQQMETELIVVQARMLLADRNIGKKK